jgi:hypothetical protein
LKCATIGNPQPSKLPFRKAFLQANASQIKIAAEKRIAQRFYLRQVAVDLQKGTAAVSGVQGPVSKGTFLAG